MAECFNPGDFWVPFGAFSQMVIGGGGQPVHLKGQVALNRDGEVVGAGDMRAQVRQVLDNISLLLASVNGRMSDIVSLTQYTTDISAFMQAGDIRKGYFDPPYPVTTTVEVVSLYDPSLLIEMTAFVEIPRDRFQRPDGARECMDERPGNRGYQGVRPCALHCVIRRKHVYQSLPVNELPIHMLRFDNERFYRLHHRLSLKR
ncbi:RidA family protein [Kaustia mangrovi]|uniref:RidA family protein n=1 Tax=Kaustia mangrovi TaxID=2593653 RepID=A0A7S8C3R6_9HYPH|nr:RidA family protein [Kaustia mangrovi]QPC42772.1 RidA family protein [Kaustia mangrovi]